MDVNLNALLVKAITSKRWVPYFIKASALVFFLTLFATLAPVLPPICVMLFWIIVSIVSATGIIYHRVIHKARNRYGLEEGGIIARVNAGRVGWLIISFFLSAVAMAGLILEVPRWGIAEWVILILAVPLFMGVFHLVAKRTKKELKPLLQASWNIKISAIILGVLLIVIYILITLVDHAPSYSGLTEAFLSIRQPYAGSSSVLLSDLGDLNALVNGLTAFAMSRVAKGSFEVYIILRVVVCSGVAFGIASLISVCALTTEEMKLAFMPLEAVDKKAHSIRPVGWYAAAACVLPAIAIFLCVYADARGAEASQTEGYTAAKQVIRNQVGMAAYVIDGKPYDYDRVVELHGSLQESAQALAEERKVVLVPLVNEIYDKQIENVDDYLDWYYSLPADYERLVRFFSGTIEDGMKEQLSARINEGVDDSALADQIKYFRGRYEELETNAKNELARYDLSKYGIDENRMWLVIPQEIAGLKSHSLDELFAPTRGFTNGVEHIGVSAGTGALSGVVASIVVKKIVGKTVFKEMLKKLSSILVVRGFLAVGGTALVPVVGTAVGVGAGVGVDFLFLKTDELMNRASNREEIVGAIEENRKEMLEAVSS